MEKKESGFSFQVFLFAWFPVLFISFEMLLFSIRMKQESGLNF